MVNKKDYTYFGRYKSPLIYHWLLENWANNELGKKYGLPELDGRLLLLDGHLSVYKKDWEIIKQRTRQAVEQFDKKYFKSIFRLMNSEIKKMLQVARKLNQGKDLSVKLFQDYFQAMNHMEYPWFYVLPMNEVLEEIVRKKLSDANLPEQHLQSFFELKKPTLLMKQKRETIEIKKQLIKNQLLEKIQKLSANDALKFLKQNSPKIHQKIVNHINNYKWFGMMHMWGTPFSEEKLLEQLKAISTDKKIKPKEPKLSKELEWLRKQTRELSYWRNHVAEICGMASYLAIDKLKEASDRVSLTYDLASYFSPSEFLDGLKEGFTPSRKILEERKKAFGLAMEKGKIVILTGKKLKQIINSVLEDVSKDSEITGVVANPGKVIGKVKIVLSPDDIKKVKKGDIMVSAETTPDFVPAVHKAAALVTDIGGITSHAAIISREFNIPCIVGTKVATRVLKDYDKIKVDAEKGIIKKL